VLPFIVRRGFHPKLGACAMRDSIEKLVGDAVAVDLLTKRHGHEHLSVVDVGNCLVVTRQEG
jgi:ATP-dependent Clp protease ATP-binding subunit ClpA